MTDNAAVSTAASVIAVDTAAPSQAAVEHLVHEIDRSLDGLLPEEYVVSTHIARAPAAHHVVVIGGPVDRAAVVERLLASLEGLTEVGSDADAVLLATDAALVDAARDAAAEHRSRRSGRLARYPGRVAIEGRVTTAEVLARSGVDAIEGLAGTTVTPDAVLDLTGFARPTWRDGRCTLLVQRGRDALVPFEMRDQIPCCSAH